MEPIPSGEKDGNTGNEGIENEEENEGDVVNTANNEEENTGDDAYNEGTENEEKKRSWHGE